MDRNTGSGLGKRESNRGAKAARGTGDQGGLAFEAELVEY
jgi:hypothetical protein